MGRIDDDAAAERLARSILADISLYHEREIATGAPGLGSAVDEGRALFQERVDPALHAVFEEVLAGSPLAPWGAVVRADGYRAARRVVPLAGPKAPAPPQSSVAIPILVALTGVGVALFYYFTWYAR